MVKVTLDTTDGKTVQVYRKPEPDTNTPEKMMVYVAPKVVFQVGKEKYEFLEEDFRSMAQAFISLERPSYEMSI